MDEKKREMILAALEIYMKLGIKSITMDEMARQLGVSKKTLYLCCFLSFKDTNNDYFQTPNNGKSLNNRKQ